MTNQEVRKIIKWHLAPVKKLMQLSRQHKRRFYARIELSTEDYIKNNPNATAGDIKNFLGDPVKLIDDYKKEVGPDAIHKAYKCSRWKTIGISAAIIVTLLVGTYFGYRYMKSLQTMVVVENPTVIYKN